MRTGLGGVGVGAVGLETAVEARCYPLRLLAVAGLLAVVGLRDVEEGAVDTVLAPLGGVEKGTHPLTPGAGAGARRSAECSLLLLLLLPLPGPLTAVAERESLEQVAQIHPTHPIDPHARDLGGELDPVLLDLGGDGVEGVGDGRSTSTNREVGAVVARTHVTHDGLGRGREADTQEDGVKVATPGLESLALTESAVWTPPPLAPSVRMTTSQM